MKKYKTTDLNHLFYTENSLFLSQNSGELFLQWNLDKNSLKIVNELMKKEFGKKYIQPKTTNKSIIIKL